MTDEAYLADHGWTHRFGQWIDPTFRSLTVNMADAVSKQRHRDACQHGGDQHILFAATGRMFCTGCGKDVTP